MLGPTKDQKRRHGFATFLDPVDFMPRKTAAEKTDEVSVRYFAGKMLDKMDKAGASGRYGWQDKELVTPQQLENKLLRAKSSGDWVSVANYAMMLQIRQELKVDPYRTPVIPRDVDVCTDPNNCKRCKAGPSEKHLYHHAGLVPGKGGEDGAF